MKKRILALWVFFTLVFTFSFSTIALADSQPEIVGTSAIIMDLETKEIVYSKNIDEKKQPASLTKLMTALLLAENKSKTDLLTYPAAALNEAPYSYGLNVHPVTPGDTFTAKDAMDILLLYSGNDIAYMIAENVGGTKDNFINMMNEKAKALGMTNTNFVTPNGLDDNTDDHYTTSYDLALLLDAAYSNEWIRETMDKKESEVKSTNGPSAIVENRNKLIGVDGNIGGKTGYTEKSGRCLAALYQRNGRTLATIVLGSDYNFPVDTQVFEDTTKLSNYGFNAQKEVFKAKDSEISEVTMEYNIIPLIGPKKAIKIPVTIHEDISLYPTDLEPELNSEVEKINVWTLSKDKSIGNTTVSVKGYEKQYDVYSGISNMDIIKSNILYYILALLVLIIVVFLVLLIISKINRNRRNKKRRIYR
ncbi:D-alanyl-D-alanine carboxypeptidase family protein [Clostridium sp. UBA1056]|uniref:D-alanyl-D-alanine carboxypeptidase family protein n=1 Tax=unclassified Clostridium TaxID=2614128 RepID=UPI0032174E47